VILEPLFNLGGLVDLEVVEDRVHFSADRDLRLESVEELEELDPGVAVIDLANHLAGVHEQRGEQCLDTMRLYSNSRRAGFPASTGSSLRIGWRAWDRGLLI
jgi:hypothetical protein